MCCCVLCAVYYFLQIKNEMQKVQDAFFENTMDFFNDNENIADALSSKFTDLRSRVPKGAENDSVLLEKATNSIQGIYQNISGYKSQGKRYVISNDDQRLFGFSQQSDWSREKESYPLFKSAYIELLPRYIERKLAKLVVEKGLTSTRFYIDPVTDQKAYSLLSFIYDFAENRVVGVLFYDRDAEEFMSNFILHRMNDFYSYSIIDDSNNEELCIKGACEKGGITSERHYSYRYTLHISQPYLSAILHNPGFISIIAVLFAMVVILYALYIKKIFDSEMVFLRDKMTGTYNRNLLNWFGNNDLQHAHVVLVDCNKFKFINDTYGHHAGDMALVRIAETIQQSIRENDYLIRLGGDEFCIIVFTDDFTIAENIAARAADNIKVSNFSVDNNAIELGVSYGVATLFYGLENGLREADSAMYDQKHRMREE